MLYYAANAGVPTCCITSRACAGTFAAASSAPAASATTGALRGVEHAPPSPPLVRRSEDEHVVVRGFLQVGLHDLQHPRLAGHREGLLAEAEQVQVRVLLLGGVHATPLHTAVRVRCSHPHSPLDGEVYGHDLVIAGLTVGHVALGRGSAVRVAERMLLDPYVQPLTKGLVVEHQPLAVDGGSATSRGPWSHRVDAAG